MLNLCNKFLNGTIDVLLVHLYSSFMHFNSHRFSIYERDDFLIVVVLNGPHIIRPIRWIGNSHFILLVDAFSSLKTRAPIFKRVLVGLHVLRRMIMRSTC